jgi:hypothetical protein
MTIRLHPESDSIETVWDDLVYLYARLNAFAETKDLAPSILALITTSEEVWRGQRKVWREETEAQSGVDNINFRTDERTEDLHADLVQANRKHPQGESRQERYFPLAKSKIIELGLASQMKYVEDYANSLPKEAEPELQAHGKGFAEDATDGRAALTALATAVANRRDHRVKEIEKFRTTANETRTTVYGELLKRSQGKPKKWADSFFRKRTQNTPEERRLEKSRDAIYTNCELYGLILEKDQTKKIQQESDDAVLLQWLRNTATAKTAAELFKLAQRDGVGSV